MFYAHKENLWIFLFFSNFYILWTLFYSLNFSYNNDTWWPVHIVPDAQPQC